MPITSEDVSAFVSFVATSPALVGLFGTFCGTVGGIVGAFLAHRWALQRDRRKDWNEAADRAYATVERGDLIDMADVRVLESLMTRWQRARFRRAQESYREQYELHTYKHGVGPTHPDMKAMTRATDRLLARLARR